MSFRVASLAIPVTIAAVLVMPAAVGADFTGDGVDEVGAAAVDDSGNWIQIFDLAGNSVFDKIILSGFVNVRNVTTDVNGDGRDELITMATNSSNGRGLVQVRNSLGQLIGQALLPLGFSPFALFPVNFNGGPRTEIGVGFVNDSNGALLIQIFQQGGGALTALFAPPQRVLGGPLSPLDVKPADVDGDGNEEVVAFFLRDDGFRGFKVFEPQTSVVSLPRFPVGTVFSNVSFLVDDFVPAEAGDEILAGMDLDSGAGFFRTVDEGGTILSQGVVQPTGFEDRAWKSINNGDFNLMLLGGTLSSNDIKVYKIFNPINGNTFSTAGIGLVGNDVIDWLPGNFDAVNANGEEVAVVYRRADGATGFEIRNRAGDTQLASRLPFGTSFANSQAISVLGTAAGAHDLVVAAKLIGGRPQFTAWDGFGNLLVRQSTHDDTVF